MAMSARDTGLAIEASTRTSIHIAKNKTIDLWLDQTSRHPILKRTDEAVTLFSFAVCLSSAPAFNISVNCHNFSESKVKVETGGLKLSYCSQTSLSRNGWPKAVILLVITDNF